MSLQAVIFDLDGVLTDTAELHYHTWQALADAQGWRFDRDLNERLRGMLRRDSLEIILAANGCSADETQIAAWLDYKNRLFLKQLDEITPADLLPGVLPFLHELRAAGVRIALGSGSQNARSVLQRLGIAALFDAVADGRSMARSKPAPDLFLLAANQLGVAPAECVVIEDASAGVEAAQAAGMPVVGIGPVERLGRADLRLDSTASLSLQTVRRVLAASDHGRASTSPA